MSAASIKQTTHCCQAGNHLPPRLAQGRVMLWACSRFWKAESVHSYISKAKHPTNQGACPQQGTPAGARCSPEVGPGEGDTLRPQRDALGLRSRVPLI